MHCFRPAEGSPGGAVASWVAAEESIVLKKILRIENVGKFKKCTPRGDVSFRKLNLIYAENGRGKTTFCDILRSLQTGNGELIHGRGTLGIAEDPVVELRFDQNITFKNGSWDTAFPNIALFDDTFVYENVHAGEFVQHDQKRGLYGVIIGATGVALQRKVDVLDTQSRDAAKDLKNAQSALKGYLPEDFTEADFLALEPGKDIDEKITIKQGELKAVENAAAIAARSTLSRVDLPEFSGQLAVTLTRTLAMIEADTETRVREHLADCTREATQSWISDGLGYERDDTCPFCGQDTSDVDLIRAYRVCFGEEYEALREKVNTLRIEADQAGNQARILSIQRVLEQNHHHVDFWREFIGLTPPALSMDDLKQALAEYTTTATALLDRKAASILQPIAADDELASIQTSIDQVTAVIGAYNTAVDEANRLIERKKADTGAADATAVQKELARLEAIKKRHEPDVDKACQAVFDANKEKTRIEGEKKKAKATLDQHGNAILPKFQSHINKLLRNFGVGFRIQNVERRFAGGKASSNYQLLINEIPVDLGDPNTSVGEPSFRNTLSAGDRRTLALAFFIAQLKLDPALNDKLVILDDPFTSQDSSRRTCTQQQICRLAKEAKQVMVLSHEASFLAKVHEEFPNHAEVKTLQFARVGPDETVVAEWDITDATRGSYQKDYFFLQGFLSENNGEPLAVARAIRPMLEGYLRIVCPGVFPKHEWLGGFIEIIRNADTGDPAYVFHSQLEELEDINDFSKRYHHKKDSTEDAEPIDDGELRAFVERTLDFVSAPAQA